MKAANLLTSSYRRLLKLLLLFIFSTSFTVATLFGQAHYIFDEWGNARVYPSGAPPIHTNAFMGELGSDPSGGVAGNVLIYTINSGLHNGDILLSNDGVNVTDIVRFWNTSGGGFGTLGPGFTTKVIFYSLSPGPAPADTGLPSTLLGTFGPLTAVGDPSYLTVDYSSFSGIGADGGGAPEYYLFITQGAVPEPTTLSLAMLVGGTLLLWNRRRKNS